MQNWVAKVEVPTIMCIPNFNPIACTLSAIGLNDVPFVDGQRDACGKGRHSSSRDQSPVDYTSVIAKLEKTL